MAYETGQQLYHRVELEGRDKLTVSGVEDVERFNGIPFVPQKFRNFPAILEHRKIQANPL